MIPATPLLGIIYEDNEISVSKVHLHLMLMAALFTIAKTWKQPESADG